MTDLWTSEELEIVPSYSIGFFYANSTVTEGAAQKFATGVANAIKCQDATAYGDGFGIALKAATAGEWATVAVHGLIKCKVDGSTVVPQHAAIVTGDFLMNSAATYLVKPLWDRTSVASIYLKAFGLNSYIMGMALQPSTASGDEILVLLGKTA